MKNERKMFFGASAFIFRTAEQLRLKETESEKILWNRLKSNQLFGLKFRRQHPANKYILDFYCHYIRLAIEIDGPIHLSRGQKIYDKDRDLNLLELGITTIRFTEKEVCNDIDSTIQNLASEIELLLTKQNVPPLGG